MYYNILSILPSRDFCVLSSIFLLLIIDNAAMKPCTHLQMHMCTSMYLKVDLLDCESCTSSIFLDNASIFQSNLLKCSFVFFQNYIGQSKFYWPMPVKCYVWGYLFNGNQ